MNWTKNNLNKVRKYVSQGFNIPQIADLMNTTYGSVEHGMRRYNIKAAGTQKIIERHDISKFVDKFVVKIKDIKIKALPEIPIEVIKQGKGDEEEIVLVLSDWQIGHKTRTFNIDVARDRVRNIIKTVFKIIALHRNAYPVKKINIFLLGDFIQSEDIQWKVDLSELEMIMIDQVFEGAVPLLSWLIQEMARNFEEVKIYGVRGNHGKGPKGSSEKTNFDDIIYKILVERFRDNKRIKFDIAREFYQVVKVKNYNFLLAHGDQMRGGSYGIPLYAIMQRMLRWATSIPEHWNSIVLGHWHCYGNIEQNNQELFVNGTLVSDDEFVRRSYGWNASTVQILFGVHPRRGITFRYKINLL